MTKKAVRTKYTCQMHLKYHALPSGKMNMGNLVLLLMQGTNSKLSTKVTTEEIDYKEVYRHSYTGTTHNNFLNPTFIVQSKTPDSMPKTLN